MLDIEREKHSQFSPGPVDDDERLVRLQFSPDHVDEQGKLRVEAIPRQDLVEKGLSVYRCAVALDSEEQMEHLRGIVAKRKARRPNVELYGESCVDCNDVRSQRDDDDDQALKVTDDAHVPHDLAHTAIRYANGYPPSQQKKIRNKLLSLLEPPQSPNTYLTGIAP